MLDRSDHRVVLMDDSFDNARMWGAWEGCGTGIVFCWEKGDAPALCGFLGPRFATTGDFDVDLAGSIGPDCD
jgi:hypothetical protein